MVEKNEGSQYPTLIKHFDSDEELDEYVIQNAYMFTVVQIRPGGFVRGEGSNYIREEVLVADHGSADAALEAALKQAEQRHNETGKNILIYAVANFSGAVGFNRPVRTWPISTYRSKADRRRDEVRLRKIKQAEKAMKATLKKPSKKEPRAAVFHTSFTENTIERSGENAGLSINDETFNSSSTPMVKVVKL